MGSHLGEPNSLAVDFFLYEVCWADAGNDVRGITPRIGGVLHYILNMIIDQKT